MQSSYLYSILLPLLTHPPLTTAREVFAHYMVNGVSHSSALTDVTLAQSLNITAFALDITNPTDSWATDALTYLFDAAQSGHFHLFFSLDNAAVKDLAQFDTHLQNFLGHDAYYKSGPDNHPVVSTFGEGNHGVDVWKDFRTKYADITFIPNFDNLTTYYTDVSSTLTPYLSLLDGVLNWDTAWPPSQATPNPPPASTKRDIDAQNFLAGNGKAFWAPLSTLQFKNQAAYGHWYRAGGTTLPERMADILSMQPAPDAVELLTWNDGGESHYFGQLWPETLPMSYSSGTEWDHSGWQSLYHSFASAFKDGVDSAGMRPVTGAKVDGAMWYHPMSDSSKCQDQPSGWEAAGMVVNWAVVLEEGCEGWSVVVSSGGKEAEPVGLRTGLNWGNTDVSAGKQSLRVVDGGGKVVAMAEGGVDVPEGCPESIYNYRVVGLKISS